jgi:predicted Abi (CAAX) family protease
MVARRGSRILIIGLVMLKGIFNKLTAYVGLATGILGIVSITGWNVAIIMNAVFATVWVLFVGYRLYKLGGQSGRVARIVQKSA